MKLKKMLETEEYGFVLELVDINNVINVNRNNEHGPENPIIIERDTKVLEMALEYIKNNYNKSDY